MDTARWIFTEFITTTNKIWKTSVYTPRKFSNLSINNNFRLLHYPEADYSFHNKKWYLMIVGIFDLGTGARRPIIPAYIFPFFCETQIYCFRLLHQYLQMGHIPRGPNLYRP